MEIMAIKKKVYFTYFLQIESNESKNKHKSRSVQKIQEMIIAESLSDGILI